MLIVFLACRGMYPDYSSLPSLLFDSKIMAVNERNSSIPTALLLFVLCSSFALSFPSSSLFTFYSSSSSISSSYLFLNVSLWTSRPCQSCKSQRCICPSHLIKVLFVPVKTQPSFPVKCVFGWQGSL